MYERVLIPTDGSERVDEAVAHGLEIASAHGATVHVLYVVDRRLAFAADDEGRENVLEMLRAEGRDAVAAVAEQVRDAGLDAETTVEEGIPASTILDYVAESGVDLVVMGTHGRTGRDRLAHLGSVTDRVVRGADVPVLVVGIGDDD